MECTTNKMRATMTLRMMKAKDDSKKSRNQKEIAPVSSCRSKTLHLYSQPHFVVLVPCLSTHAADQLHNPFCMRVFDNTHVATINKCPIWTKTFQQCANLADGNWRDKRQQQFCISCLGRCLNRESTTEGNLKTWSQSSICAPCYKI